MRYRRTRDSLVGVLLITVCGTHCVPPKPKARALAAIEKFHQQFNDSKFSEIYDGVVDDAKRKLPKAQFIEAMHAMRDGQGAVLSSEEIASDYRYSNNIEMLKIVTLVTFEKGKAKEEFIFHLHNGTVQLASYRFLGP